MRVIAQRLKRHPSTLYREIKRNWFHDEEPLYRGYFHVAAHAMAHGRRARLGKLARNPSLATYVVDRLQAAWSPEQIAGRLQIEPKSPGNVTHETIYAFVYSPHGKALGLFRHLPMARQRRRADTPVSRVASLSRLRTPSSCVPLRLARARASGIGKAT